MTAKQELAKKAGSIKEKELQEQNKRGEEQEKGAFMVRLLNHPSEGSQCSGCCAHMKLSAAGVVNEKGLSLLLFKDARVDQKI